MAILENPSVGPDPTRLAPNTKSSSIRHLSSMKASENDMADGPVVIAPDELLHNPSQAHETAAALELAKRHMGLVSSGTSTPVTPPETSVTGSYAFAFDIDGVLIRGGKPIPQAAEAMRVLNGENDYGIKVYVKPSSIGSLR